MLIDRYLQQQDFKSALDCLDRLHKAVHDPLLVVRRAAVLLEMEKTAEARKAIKDAIKADPDEADGYAVALDVSLADDNFDETLECLSVLEQRFGYQWKDLREAAPFAAFVKSPQFKKWESRK